jgi:adenylyltransferase/sulfurtransferase
MGMDPDRYSRQILYKPIGLEGQARLGRARVVVIGCGALGTAQASALVRAGVGRLRIIDRDYVEESNLQRQLLFDESDADQSLPKAIAAERHLREFNRDVEIEGVVADVDSRSIEQQVRGHDLILDGTDNFETRYLINDAALRRGIPWIYGAVVGSYGASFTVLPGRTPCLACVFPDRPLGLQETCDTVGVISPAVAWTAAVQIAEALKILTGHANELHGKILACDLWKNSFHQITPRVDPTCRACQRREFEFLDGSAFSRTALLCGRNAIQIRQPASCPIALGALRARLESLGPVHANDFLVRCRIDSYELTVFGDGRAVIKGTDDPAVARKIYAQYVGA